MGRRGRSARSRHARGRLRRRGARAGCARAARAGDWEGHARDDAAQVRAALGGRGLVVKRRNVGFRQVYVELEWAYGAWNVGFEGRRGSLRAVMVATTLRGQRTPHGLGPGPRARDILRVYPGATCSDWVGTGSDSSLERWIVIRHANGASIVFALLSKLHGQRAIYTVAEVGVRRPARGLSERRDRCPANWRRQ